MRQRFRLGEGATCICTNNPCRSGSASVVRRAGEPAATPATTAAASAGGARPPPSSFAKERVASQHRAFNACKAAMRMDRPATHTDGSTCGHTHTSAHTPDTPHTPGTRSTVPQAFAHAWTHTRSNACMHGCAPQQGG
jgi:hypothetical protein